MGGGGGEFDSIGHRENLTESRGKFERNSEIIAGKSLHFNT